MPSSGGSARSLYSAGGVRHLIPSWSPNGKEIAFIAGSKSGEKCDVFVVRADGTGKRRLTNTKTVKRSLQWSRSKQHIIYSDQGDASMKPHFYVISPEGRRIDAFKPIPQPSADAMGFLVVLLATFK